MLNKIVESVPAKGPINNVNDLMEKYTLTVHSAVKLCNAILKSPDKADAEPVKKALKKPVPRKMAYLLRGVKPAIQNPKVKY